MSKTDALLNSLSTDDISTYLVDSDTEEHVIVTEDRKVIVPNSLRRIAVQHDHNIETITFDCPRYWDEHDMSKMIVYINYACPGGSIGSYIATNIVVDEFDSSIMHFDWTISENVTIDEGFISFLVCVKRRDRAGVERVHWNSEINEEMYISEGLELPEDFVQSSPDILTQILLFHNDIVQLNKVTLERASVYVGSGEMPDWADIQIDPDGDDGGVIPGGSGGSGVDGLHYDKETGELYLTANGYRASDSVTIVSGSGDSSCSDDCVTEDELHEITIEEFDALWDSVFKGENNG